MNKKDIALIAIIAFLIALVSYWCGYHNGWVDSYQLFDKVRPWRPFTG